MPTSPDQVSDEDLMLRFQEGDRKAFAILVSRHKVPLYNFILRYVRNHCSAEDLTQDLFVRIVKKASSYRHGARFTTWAYSIARNLCIDHLRKMSHRRHPSFEQIDSNNPDRLPLSQRLADQNPANSTFRRATSNEIAARVSAAVDQLPAPQREVFLLRQMGKIPFKEIAKMTGASENTVKSRMRYALERLQHALSEYEDYAQALR